MNFIAWIYGMNFEQMSEPKSRWDNPIVLAVMVFGRSGNLVHVSPQALTATEKPGLFLDFDVIDEVGGVSEAGRRQVSKLFIVQDQSLPHQFRQLRSNRLVAD